MKSFQTFILAILTAVSFIFPSFSQERADSVFDASSGLFFSFIYEEDREDAVGVRVAMSGNLVTNMSSYPEIMGELNIPDRVDIEGKTYEVKGIGAHAFRGNTGITSVSVPPSVSFIGDFAFYNCYKLTDVSLFAGLRSVGKQTFASTSLNSLDLPSTVSSIGREAFARCRNLGTVTWAPYEDASVSPSAFSDTALRSAVLGAKIVRLEDYAFGNLSELAILDIGAPEPPELSGRPFDRTELSMTTLYVAPGTKKLYENDSRWHSLGFLAVEEKNSSILPREITIFATETYITVGETLHLKATVLPENATDRTVVWESSDEDVLRVDPEGNICGVTPGKATVIARCVADPEVFDTMEFTVGRAPDREEYVTLHLRAGDGGSLGIRYPAGTEAVISLLPDEGYRLSTVMLGQEEITGTVKNGVLNLGKIYLPKTLRVVFEKIVGLEEISPSSQKVTALPEGISISGLEGGEEITVMDISGRIINKLTSTADTLMIPADDGVCLLHISKTGQHGRTYKILK